MGLPSGDVVIVGGGPAGLTTAIAALRAMPALRSRLVVLEAARYPRDKYCAGAIGGRGDAILRELDASPDVPSVPIDGISLRVKDGEVAGRPGGIGRVVRRIELDDALASIARSRGAEIAEETRVLGLVERGGRVSLETSRGALEASVVVGADGVGSVVRKAMGLARGGLRAQVLEVDTEPVAADRDRGMLHFDASDRRLAGYTWDFPTIVGGRALVCRGIYQLKVDAPFGGEPEADLQALFSERLAGMGLDLAAHKNKRFAERGFEPDAPIAKGRCLLAGEAAGIDPVTGEGIAQAIEYGALAGRFLATALASGGALEGWSETVRRSRLARDLSIRTRAVRAFYGPERPRMERFLLGCESALVIGCQHFAAQRLDRARLAELALRGGLALLGAGASRAAARFRGSP